MWIETNITYALSRFLRCNYHWVASIHNTYHYLFFPGLAIIASLIKTVSIAETQYFLFLVLFGSQVMYMVILVMSVRFWRENLRNPSPTPLGMVVLMIGLGTLIHQVVPMNVWIVGVYMALLGIVLGMIH